MDLIDFLIHSNALNIRLLRNLITQSHGDRFHEYIHKWQLFNNCIKLHWYYKFLNKFVEVNIKKIFLQKNNFLKKTPSFVMQKLTLQLQSWL